MDFLGIFLALAGMTVVILGLTWGGKDYDWNSTQVITTLVVGTAVSVAFMFWQWKGPKYPLIPCKNLQSTTIYSLTDISAHIQVKDCQRCMSNHGHQRLELRHASLLHTLILSTRSWLFRHQIGGNDLANHAAPDRQQYTLRPHSALGRSLSGVYPLRMALLGCRSWPDVNSG